MRGGPARELHRANTATDSGGEIAAGQLGSLVADQVRPRSGRWAGRWPLGSWVAGLLAAVKLSTMHATSGGNHDLGRAASPQPRSSLTKPSDGRFARDVGAGANKQR